MNTITVSGRLGADAEVRTTPNGKQRARMRVCVSERYKATSGQWEEKSFWVSVGVWISDQQTWLLDGLVKGAGVVACGKLQIREYEHNGQKRSDTEIDCFPEGIVKEAPRGASNRAHDRAEHRSDQERDRDDEIPF